MTITPISIIMIIATEKAKEMITGRVQILDVKVETGAISTLDQFSKVVSLRFATSILMVVLLSVVGLMKVSIAVKFKGVVGRLSGTGKQAKIIFELYKFRN